MPQADHEPTRFREMTRRSRRDRDVSRAAVAILKADSRVGQALERALMQAGLTVPQFNVLMELAATEGAALPLYELNSRLINTAPNTSWLSSKMVDAGLVTKTKNANDSRVVILALTERGWAALEQAAPLAFNAERQLLDGYTKQELRVLGDLLGRLVGEPSGDGTQPRRRSVSD
jgi:DNA-binding MarR family transcriptional regulator